MRQPAESDDSAGDSGDDDFGYGVSSDEEVRDMTYTWVRLSSMILSCHDACQAGRFQHGPCSMHHGETYASSHVCCMSAQQAKQQVSPEFASTLHFRTQCRTCVRSGFGCRPRTRDRPKSTNALHCRLVCLHSLQLINLFIKYCRMIKMCAPAVQQCSCSKLTSTCTGCGAWLSRLRRIGGAPGLKQMPSLTMALQLCRGEASYNVQLFQRF